MRRAIRDRKGLTTINVTDKAFRYTNSFNTDLRKKFRKLEQERRASAAGNKVPGAARAGSVVAMAGRRSTPNT